MSARPTKNTVAAPARAELLVALENATLRVRDRRLLPGTHWRIQSGQHWVVMGPNGSGKTTLVRSLTGSVPVVEGRLVCRPGKDDSRPLARYVSFEAQAEWFAREAMRDEARSFSGHEDELTTAREVIFGTADAGGDHPGREAMAVLGVEPLLPRAVYWLSTGERRKVWIARALAAHPRLLILDEPFDGLDTASRSRLSAAIGALMGQGVQLVLVTHRQEEIPAGITHTAVICDGKVTTGAAAAIETPELSAVDPPARVGSALAIESHVEGNASSDLIRFRSVTVTYDGRRIIDRLSWRLQAGQNWAVVGPNGSGKTTILRLIAADHPQAYANDIVLFGRQRGEGESIWEIRRRIGWVSAELQIRYRKPLTALEVVLSGFFDSVGLYRTATRRQVAAAGGWLADLGIDRLKDARFDTLSYGQQRLVLIARALVKAPELLIMDEPCQGLDTTNRRLVLGQIEALGSLPGTSLLYVTHHDDELLSCITHVLALGWDRNGRWRFRLSQRAAAE
jgi:molybdate transport system ATP-binding protein